MTDTITNVDAFLKARLTAYPDFDTADYGILVGALDAVQQFYFEKISPETAIYTLTLDSSLCASLSSVTPESGCIFTEEDVLSLLLEGRELRRVGYAEYTESTGGCFTVANGTVFVKSGASPTDREVSLICRKRPAHLTVSSGNCTGRVFIPEKHLPLFCCRLKECVSRLVGDDADADSWAKAYNEWIEVLSSEHAGRGRAKIGGTL